nr:hypothetical protein [Clostridia bacterium]
MSGCQSRHHELLIEAPETIRVNETINACAFVKSVDGIQVEPGMQQGDQIVADGKIIIGCNSSLTLSELGDYLLEYQINERQTEGVTVKVIDDLAPEIKVSQEEFEVEEGNEYFDISNEVSFSDNYDKEFLHSIDHDIDINRPGDYRASIYARDSSGNETRKSVLVKVVEKEKIVETVYIQSGGGNSGSQSGNQGGGTTSSETSINSNPDNPAPSPSPAAPAPSPSPSGISGVHNISVPVGTDFNTVYFELSQISASCSVSIDASEVNTSAPGSYTVYYSGLDGSSATAVVTVY